MKNGGASGQLFGRKLLSTKYLFYRKTKQIRPECTHQHDTTILVKCINNKRFSLLAAQN